MTPTLAASAAVFRDGKVLLGRRSAATSNTGLWTLPGGRVEPGETLAAAALRELAEETGVIADLCGMADIVEHIEREGDAVRKHFVIVAFAALWSAREPEPGAELDDMRWVDPETLGGLAVTRGLEQVVRRAAGLVAAATSPGAVAS